MAVQGLRLHVRENADVIRKDNLTSPSKINQCLTVFFYNTLYQTIMNTYQKK
jgi:hypothetical protein